MADVSDEATRLEEAHRAAALAAAAHPGASVNRLPNARVSCSDCGDVIPAKRLRAVPDATRCLSCQEDHEQVERRSA